MIHILYSNDYELFLGGNRSSESEVLLEPTDRLLSACRDSGIPMTLFCDVACLWRYHRSMRHGFATAAEAQLMESIGGGHDVQAHVHPHWLGTRIAFQPGGGSRYSFDPQTFLLGNLKGDDPESRHRAMVDLLFACRSYLETLLQPADQHYRCVAFRAGGYGIQPRVRALMTALRSAGFLIDSSVVPGLVLKNRFNRIDFSVAPTGKTETDFSLYGQNSVGAPIIEIPVAAMDSQQPVLFRQALRSTIRRLGRRAAPRRAPMGWPVQAEEKNAPPTFLKALANDLRQLCKGWLMLELGTDHQTLFDLTRNYISRYQTRGKDLYFSFSCHSKSITDRHLSALERYHRCLLDHYGTQIVAITFREAAARIVQSKDRPQSKGDRQ